VGKALIIFGDAQDRRSENRIAHIFRDGAHFLSTPTPMVWIVD
jgi:hypothetical protein